MKDERKEIDIVVTFGCQNSIHVYYKNCGVVPATPFRRHDSVEKARLYMQGCRRIQNPAIIEHIHKDVKFRTVQITLPQARELAEFCANNGGAPLGCLAKILLSNFTLEELRPQDAEMEPLAEKTIPIYEQLKQEDFMINEHRDMPREISLEEARAIWKTIPKDNPSNWSASDRLAREILLHNFKEEALEIKGFTWANSFEGGGWYISPNSDVMFSGISSNPTFQNKNVFKTKKQAESALAFAQLSHIVEKYNEDNFAVAKDGKTTLYYVAAYNDNSLKIDECQYFECIQPVRNLMFNKKESAERSMEVNRELWEKYWMIWDK